MGSGASKSASSAAKTASKLPPANTARKYPTRIPPPSSRQTKVSPSRPSPEAELGSSAHAHTRTSERGDAAITQVPDPALNARLSQLGPVQPNPTQSNSSTFNNQPRPSHSAEGFQPSASTPSQTIFPSAKQNPAVSLLTARYRLQGEAEEEFGNVGRKGAPGRQFLDVTTIRQILALRDEKGVEAGEIERRLGLREGVVGRLGRRGVVMVSSMGEAGRE